MFIPGAGNRLTIIQSEWARRTDPRFACWYAAVKPRCGGTGRHARLKTVWPFTKQCFHQPPGSRAKSLDNQGSIRYNGGIRHIEW